MKVIEVYDDLAWARSESKIKAIKTRQISYDGETFELDLGEGNLADIDKLMAEWKAAGRLVEARPKARQPKASGAHRGQYNGRSREENKALREWVDAEGIRARRGRDRPAYRTDRTNKHYYPDWLWKLFDAREDIKHGLGEPRGSAHALPAEQGARQG